MSYFEASIDVPIKNMDGRITVMGEIRKGGVQYVVEGGGSGLSQVEAEAIAKGILRCIKKTRSAYHRFYGERAP